VTPDIVTLRDVRAQPFASFDQRCRPETLRTAIATAFFCPTRSTSRLGDAGVGQIAPQHRVVLSVMTGIITAGYSGSTGSRAAEFGYRYAPADSLWQQGGRSEAWSPLSLWYAPPGVDLSAFGERGWL
jgi:hypothetical protein